MQISNKLYNLLKHNLDNLGFGVLARQLLVEVMLLGERTKFAILGRPETNMALLLAGSGRSGTTWITELICSLPGVQQIFEPLFPPWNDQVREITGWDMSNPYIRSLYLRANQEYPRWNDLWQRILTGRFRNYWTDYERNAWFPDRFLVKEVRANLMLGYLYRNFQPRMIYILRHPCAVVHSRLALPQPWHADVEDILSQSELVADYLQAWVFEIEQETDLTGAHAVWWAVENHVALQQLKEIPHYLVYYEDLISRPREVLETLLPWLGVEEIPEKAFSLLSQPSRMSNEIAAYQNINDRLSHWKNRLSGEDQERVLSWAGRLGLTMYDESPFPKMRSSAHVP